LFNLAECSFVHKVLHCRFTVDHLNCLFSLPTLWFSSGFKGVHCEWLRLCCFCSKNSYCVLFAISFIHCYFSSTL